MANRLPSLILCSVSLLHMMRSNNTFYIADTAICISWYHIGTFYWSHFHDNFLVMLKLNLSPLNYPEDAPRNCPLNRIVRVINQKRNINYFSFSAMNIGFACFDKNSRNMRWIEWKGTVAQIWKKTRNKKRWLWKEWLHYRFGYQNYWKKYLGICFMWAFWTKWQWFVP